ncbi:kinase-like domain-containing protein [Myxozyma melibiosi]|uniref:Kinase-like domain-containing protein n=1 Tax=Myxozyma melibiosi TaxID=54550 RepID=A0ABR1F105_9ASCO
MSGAYSYPSLSAASRSGLHLQTGDLDPPPVSQPASTSTSSPSTSRSKSYGLLHPFASDRRVLSDSAAADCSISIADNNSSCSSTSTTANSLDNSLKKPSRQFSWRNPKPRTNSLRRSLSIRDSSDPTSPASRFLSMFNSAANSAPEPDDEGQEVSEYVIGKTIGYGGFSTVKEAHTLEHGRDVTRAVKIVRKSSGEQALADLDHELTVWKCIPAHPHILRLISVHESSFATFCFMEYANLGSVFDAAIKRRRHRTSSSLAGSIESISDSTASLLSESPVAVSVKKRWVYELCCALRLLHQDLRIVHRDVKPENCVLHVDSPSSSPPSDISRASLRLCDFGMAQFYKEDRSAQQQQPQPQPEISVDPQSSDSLLSSPVIVPEDGLSDADDTSNNLSSSVLSLSQSTASLSQSMTELDITGSVPYLPPELLVPRGLSALDADFSSSPDPASSSTDDVSPAQDIWALGVFTYALFTRHLPFSHSFLPKLQSLIIAGEWDRDLLSRSVDSSSSHDDSSSAPEIDAEALVDFVARCFEMNPYERWDIGQVMQHRLFEGLNRE